MKADGKGKNERERRARRVWRPAEHILGRMPNVEVVMTNQYPNNLMTKFGPLSFLGHWCLDIRHFPPSYRFKVNQGSAGKRLKAEC